MVQDSFSSLLTPDVLEQGRLNSEQHRRIYTAQDTSDREYYSDEVSTWDVYVLVF